MPKYVAARKDVCAGKLLKMSYKVYDKNNNELSKEGLEKQELTGFSMSYGLICRGMLFSVNENGLTNDLIYNTPTNYPIEGIKPSVATQSKFVVQNYVELEELLKYLKYGVDLTQKDLLQIYRKLITNICWLEDNMELFGWKKMNCIYTNDGTQTIPMSIYDNLNSINCSKNGKPHKEEPEYSLIKKRR